MSAPELIVTNFNPNFTGVSATAAAVVRGQMERYDMRLVGAPLPGCPAPTPLRAARAECRGAARPVIWHVRRNPEMRAALWARDVLRLPIRIVFTSAAQRLHSAYPRWLISRMDAVIATTDAAATFVPHVRAVVPHGVDTTVFHPTPDRAAAWTALGYGGARGIACVGRIRPEKGTDIVVQTLLDTLPHIPDTCALLIGKISPKDSDFAKHLMAKIVAAGLSDRIRFTGEIPPEKMAQIMPALSLMLALPRYEGYGMTPLEAMACGVPFVASDTGYFSTFSDAGQAGTVVPLEAPASAAAALRDLLETPQRLAQMSQHALHIARTRHSVTREIEDIDGVFQGIWADAT
jgi:mannosyltransferase